MNGIHIKREYAMDLWGGTICENCTKEKTCEDRAEYLKRNPDCIIYGCSECDTKKTNANRIRAMTDEELSQFFHDYVACDDCPVGDSKCKRAFALCKNTALAWLKSPVEEGE